jgi:enoyl-CoA hydratase/carnithine racemase
MEYANLKTGIEPNGVGIITLSNPEKKNAISIQMRRELISCLAEWRTADNVKLVIFTGEGSVFSAGFDLEEFRNPGVYDSLFDTSARYHRDIWYFPKPVIAAVNGPALAGAFDLTKLCDIRICSEKASFGHPEIKFGVPPLMTPLRWIVGEGIAREICMTGRRIDAAEAYRIGLANEVVTGDKLMARALQIGAEILLAPPEAVQFIKQYALDHGGRGFEESFTVEHDKAFQEFLLRKGAEAARSKG